MGIQGIALVWSFRKELTYVLLAFLGVLLLPVIAVVILTNTGINIVSNKLVSFNSNTKEIEIHNPINGSIIATINEEIVWPVKGVITLEFGQSDLPYQPVHTGIDIANPYGKIGDPITPFMKGKVIYAGEISWGFGKHIIIDNGNNIQSIYAHLSKIYVYVGEEVKPGDTIGEEGETGWATGPHLHFQINIFGIPVNPRVFLGEGNPQ
jgi:murein DD-endopeptidase MepM/ murein hydrolase activator NlpD